jgi:serine/threonine protein kinase
VAAQLLTQYQAGQLLIGKYRGFILGPYRILQPLGRGGMGNVFLAEHGELQRKVAIKVLHADKAQDKLALERFFREARSAAALDHPNIVRLYDISQGNGVYFLIMEYVDGNDLQSLMAKTGPLHFAQAAHYTAQAAAGLQHAHAKGFIHRDIKPANLILSKDGVVKILDMGLARSVLNERDNLTAAVGAEPEVTGTVDFISPEQAMGSPLDERSDIYNLGATFFALLTGHPPFAGTTTQKLMQHQLKDPQSLANKLKGKVPAALGAVVMKMMAKKAPERFQTAEEVVDALGPWLPATTSGNIVRDPLNTADLPRTGPGSGPNRANESPEPRRHRVALGVVGALIVLVSLVGVVAGFFLGGSKPATSLAQNPAPGNPTKPNPAPDNPNPDAPQPQPGPVEVPVPKKPRVGDYRLDFSSLTPTKYKIDRPGRWIREPAIGELSLPAGVYLNHWLYEGSAEYTVGDYAGSRALGVKQTVGGWGAQYDFECDEILTNLNPGERATVRLTYGFEGGENASAFIEAAGSRQRFTGLDLVVTNGQWKTVDLPFTRPDVSERFKLIVRPSNNSDKNGPSEGTVWVKSVEVFDPAVPRKAIWLPQHIDFASLSPVTQAIETPGKSVYSRTLGTVALPGGVFINHWNKDVSAEYLVADFAGARALGVRQTVGAHGAQYDFYEKSLTSLTAGDAVVVRINYAFEGDGTGSASVERVTPWKNIERIDLPSTGGQWKTLELLFTRPEGAETYKLVIRPSNKGDVNGTAEGTLWLKSVDLLDPARTK